MSSIETITPFYFGQNSDLYGCHHLTTDYELSPAMVICQPTGHEYERCHRAMRQLAVQSAKKGLSAMRFDYRSTGDSAGNCEDLSLSQMRLDIQQAIKNCREKTGVDQLIVVGLRLGATLAAQLASSSSEIDCLVLYAPVFDGEKLLNEWQHEQQVFYDRHNHLLQPVERDEILGFPVTEKFRKELCRKFSPEVPSSSLKRVLTLVDEGQLDSAPLNQWMENFKQRGIEVTLEAVEDIAIWQREPMDAIVPVKSLRHILNWILAA